MKKYLIRAFDYALVIACVILFIVVFFKTIYGGQTMCNKILVPFLGTLAVMEYADAHPSHVFNATCFVDGHGHSLVASEYHPDEAFMSLDEDGAYIWHTTPDGWQRIYADCGWVCRKGERYIFITN